MQSIEPTNVPLKLGGATEQSPAAAETGDEWIEIERRAIHYRRSPSLATTWEKVSAEEFPWFGMAEVMLLKSDEELVSTWREVPEAARLVAKAFEQIGARWLDGAEAMAAMIQRMRRARDVVEAEREGGAA